MLSLELLNKCSDTMRMAPTLRTPIFDWFLLSPGGSQCSDIPTLLQKILLCFLRNQILAVSVLLNSKSKRIMNTVTAPDRLNIDAFRKFLIRQECSTKATFNFAMKISCFFSSKTLGHLVLMHCICRKMKRGNEIPWKVFNLTTNKVFYLTTNRKQFKNVI